MPPSSADVSAATPAHRGRGPRIPVSPLIACGPFAATLTAAQVAGAVASGLIAAGGPVADVLTLDDAAGLPAEAVRHVLAEDRFDARLLGSRALILALERLGPNGLAGSLTLELATRARQSGVPAYAVTRENRLNEFEARMLDLQAILVAPDAPALRRAGRALAELL